MGCAHRLSQHRFADKCLLIHVHVPLSHSYAPPPCCSHLETFSNLSSFLFSLTLSALYGVKSRSKMVRRKAPPYWAPRVRDGDTAQYNINYLHSKSGFEIELDTAGSEF